VYSTPDDGQRNCPKHVEFHSKNKFQKLMQLVGFVMRIYHDALNVEFPPVRNSIMTTALNTVKWLVFTTEIVYSVNYKLAFYEYQSPKGKS